MPHSLLTPEIKEQIARLGTRRHHGRHPELQERGDDRLRGPRGTGRARPVLPRPPARRRQLRRRFARRDPRVVVETEPPDYVEKILLVRPTNKLRASALTYPEIDGVGGKGAALRTIFEIAAALDVQALVVVDSDLRSIVPEWIELLAGPILKGGYDFVTPLYARYKYDGTITNTVTYPLTRALYGHRIRQPIGGDFGVSGDLVRHYLAADDWTDDVSKFGIDIWMTTYGPRRRVRGLPDAAGRQDPRSRRTRAPTSARCSARSSARSCGWPTSTCGRTGRPSRAAMTCRRTASSGSSTRRRSR